MTEQTYLAHYPLMRVAQGGPAPDGGETPQSMPVPASAIAIGQPEGEKGYLGIAVGLICCPAK